MKSLCLNRISKDLKEIIKTPLEGIGITSIDNDPMKYIVNMKIMSGVYEGYCLQLLLIFPEQYPIKPPTLLIYPGQYFDNTYHHHIFQSNLKDEEGNNFFKFCYDLLQNDFLPTSAPNTGWNPSYTISAFLLQVQTFLSNPDYPNGYIPEKEKIDKLMKSMDIYKKSFIIRNDKNEEKTIVHTWKNPYPEMYFKSDKNSNNNEIKNKEDNEFDKLKIIKENLNCFITRLNYIDNRNVIFGYPLKKLCNKGLLPIPEILSYEGFNQETSKNDSIAINSFNDFNNIEPINFTFNNNNINNNVNNQRMTLRRGRRIRNDNNFNAILRLIYSQLFEIFLYYDNRYKSANNELYDSWLPIYINDEHFEKNKKTIIKYFQNNNYDKCNFQTKDIFSILLNILSEMIIKMIEGNISSAFLKCFFQYALMFIKFQKKYNKMFIDFQKDYLEKYLKEFKIVNIKDMKKEFIQLLILFLFCKEIEKYNIQPKFDNLITKIKNKLYISLLDRDNLSFIDKTKLNIDIKKNNLDDKIGYIIFKGLKYHWILVYDVKYYFMEKDIINAITEELNTHFIELYSILHESDKNCIKNILIEQTNISKYLNINALTEKFKSLNPDLKISEEIYKFISLFDLLREKILSQNYMEELEKNFGVCLDTERYIEEIKNKTLDDEYIMNILKKYNLFSFDELYLLNYYCQKGFYFMENMTYIKHSRYHPYSDIYLNMMFEPKIFDAFKNIYSKLRNLKHVKTKKEKNKIKYKDKLKRNNFNIKISYDRLNNKRFKKYINHKNINRLLLFKKNHY